MLQPAPHTVRRNWPLLFGTMILLVILGMMLFGPALAPRDPMAQLYALRIGDRFVGPPYPPFASAEFPLGSDIYGRDTLSRLLLGVQPTMILVTMTALLRLLVGMLIGLIAGWSQGMAGRVASLLNDVALATPGLIVALLTLAFVGADSGVGGFVLALTITGWVDTARLVAAQVGQVRSLPFIQAAQVLGASNGYIVVRHVLRQVLPFSGILFAFDAARTLLLTATLGFLGYFIGGGAWMTTGDFSARQEAGLPELGQMLSISGNILSPNWAALVVGCVVVLIVLGFNMLGEGLRRQADPLLSRRTDLLAMLGNRMVWGFEALALAVLARGGVLARAAVVLLVLGGFGWAGSNAWAQLNTVPPTPVVLVVTATPLSAVALPRWNGDLGDAGGSLQTAAPPLAEPTVRWSWVDESGLAGGPAIAADGTVYVATRGGRLVALDAEGRERWATPLAGGGVGAPALGASGEVYVVEQPGSLAAFGTDGTLRWRVPADVGREATSGPLVLPDGSLAHALVDRVRLVAPDGRVLWLSPVLDEYLDVPLRFSTDPPLLLAKNLIVLNPSDGTPIDVASLISRDQQNADPSTTLLVGANGRAYLRNGHALIELQTTVAGLQAGRRIEPNTGNLNLFFPDYAGVPSVGDIWLLYAGAYRDTRLLRIGRQGGILANSEVRLRESRMIGLDVTGTAYVCGLRGAVPACVALSQAREQPLWSIGLDRRGRIVGGALTEAGLFVATDTGDLVLLGQ